MDREMARKNVLFIMCDQLRYDYLGCYGHTHLQTPHIDALAAEGVRFGKAYVQSTICGPSRMCAYTGRYMRTHGSTSNGVPLRVGEPTIGDHLREIGVRTAIVGKSHMVADREGMERLGIPPDSVIGVHVSQCGFEPYERDDGLHPDGRYDPDPRYDHYLRDQGFAARNPWEEWANSAKGGNGATLNGWLLSHADKAAWVPDRHAETPYMTRRAMDFMREAELDGRPWCLHLSYIKPHWPYIVSAPYHELYGPDDVKAAVRADSERENPHPIFRAFMEERHSRAFSREEVRLRVIPAYMGLIKQIDDQLGLLFAFMKETGFWDNTLIVFTSDHGDYLGDHWLGEKYLFHDASVRALLIIRDPSPEADSTRGSLCEAVVETIDLAPTFLEYFGGAAKPHILEGRSLLPWLRRATPKSWRRVAVSEYDYSFDAARLRSNQPVGDCRMIMVTDGRWKYIYAEGLRPMLFDLEDDPDELVDLGVNPAHEAIRASLREALERWSRTPATRITISDAEIQAEDEARAHYDVNIDAGILIGYLDEVEVAAEKAKRDAYRAERARRLRS